MSYSPLHYRVECAMCSGSLIVESDSLQEIFQVLKNHLGNEQTMHEAQPASKVKKLGNAPHTNKEIFGSPWFVWDVTKIQPLDKIRLRVEKDIDAVLT